MVAEILEERFTDIEATVLTRVRAIPNAPEKVSPEYAVGLRAAVSTAIKFGIAALRSESCASPPVPESLVAQARLAARHHVELDTVFRRYNAGWVILDGFFLEALDRTPQLRRLGAATVRSPLPMAFDRLLEVVGKEFRTEQTTESPKSRKLLDRVTRLLAGDSVSTYDLRYNFRGHHLGLISEGDVSQAIRAIAADIGGELLLVDASPEVTWAWITRQSAPVADLTVSTIRHTWNEGAPLGLGLVSEGLAGWRRTHEQARIAFAYAVQVHRPPTSYADVALLHSIHSDDLCSSILHSLYMAPLEQERDGGRILRDTLRAYFASNRNGVSAAAALGVSRQTVSARLRTVEDLLQRPFSTCATELELALQARDIAP